MTIQTGLIRWFLRQTLPVTLGALPLACIYAMFAQGPLTWRDGWAAVFVVIHARLLVTCARASRSGGFAYLYDRGHSRDSLWAHLMLAEALAVIAVWLPASLIVWTPLRSIVQEDLFRNPFYPIMAPAERTVPLIWLLGYGMLIPVFHYVWLRIAQPTRGRYSGVILAVGFIMTGFVTYTLNYRVAWYQWLVVGGGIVVALAASIAGRCLNRRLEVKG